jgi:hypothetical protein
VSKALVKAAAVGCSVLLAAGFVSYRAGAFDSFTSPPPAPAEAEPAPVADVVPVPVTPVDDTVIFSSSKSIILTPQTPPGGSTAAPHMPILMPGSKSAKIVLPKAEAPSSPPASPSPASPSPNPAK